MTHIALGLCFIFGKLHGFVEGFKMIFVYIVLFIQKMNENNAY